MNSIPLTYQLAPKIGDTCTAKDLGRHHYHRYIWVACIDCGKERWVALRKGKPDSLCCAICSLKNGKCRKAQKEARQLQRGSNAPGWKGGKRKQIDGYVLITLQPTDPYYEMANKRSRCREHRLIMAQSLGRCLHSWEVVHHKNGIKDDNRIENLELMSRIRHHGIDTTVKAYIGRLERRIALLEIRVMQLEAENILLEESEDARK